MATSFFGVAFFGGEFFNTTAPVQTVYGAGDSWHDHVRKRYEKRHARIEKEVRKLVLQKSKLETKLKVARKKQLPVEGILANFWKVTQRIEAKQAEIKRLEIEFRLPEFGDDDDDEVLLLLT